MSGPTPLPALPDLEFLKKQAKSLLAACRAGDPAALTRARAHLGALRGKPDAALSEALRLADIQQLLALELGRPSWAVLRSDVLAMRPLGEQASRFLAAIRDQDQALSAKLLRERPALAGPDAWSAAAALDPAALEAAIKEDPAVERADEHGWTPLLYACASRAAGGAADAAERAARCAAILLAAGADANTAVPVRAGESGVRLPALYFACVAGNAGTVRLLLEHGADPNDGESLYHAAELDHRDCLALLERYGAKLGARHDDWGNTPLFFLAGYQENGAGAPRATAGMTWLLEHGADPNVPSLPSGETPLHKLITSGRRTEVIELFLDHGADPSLARGDGRTPYVLAVRGGQAVVAERLAARGASTAGVTDRDRLVGACMRGDVAAAERALANLPGGLAALAGEDRQSIARAASEEREAAVRAFLALGFDPAWEDEGGGTPLHAAAWRGNATLVRLLLEHGAPVNARDAQYGSSPMGWAGHGSRWCRSADDDYLAVVELLAAAGSGAEEAINRWGASPSDFASRRVAKRLEQLGFERKRMKA